jgi:hypothetical protein
MDEPGSRVKRGTKTALTANKPTLKHMTIGIAKRNSLFNPLGGMPLGKSRTKYQVKTGRNASILQPRNISIRWSAGKWRDVARNGEKRSEYKDATIRKTPPK